MTQRSGAAQAWSTGLVGALMLVAAGARAGAPVPTPEHPPDVFPDGGVLIEQPAAGDTVKGQWVGVTGWFDRSRYSGVMVVGAQVEGFYQYSGGHMPIPTAVTAITPDGHFFAPRVPVSEGKPQLGIIAFGKDDPRHAGQFAIEVTGVDTRKSPLTVSATPAFGNAPLEVEWRGKPPPGGSTLEWDFEGDGVFDATGNTVKHRYEKTGQYPVMARSKVGDRWIYANQPLTVSTEATVTHQATIGAHARLLTVISRNEHASEGKDEGAAGVMVVTDRGIEVFDADLKPIRILKPPSEVRGLGGLPSGEVYVALDHRLIRYRADGELEAETGFRPDGGFDQLQAFCIADRSDEYDGGTTVGNVKVIDHGRLLECSQDHDCYDRNGQLKDLRGLRCSGDRNAEMEVLRTASGEHHLYAEHGSTPRKIDDATGFTDVVLCSDEYPFLLAGVGPGEMMKEWLSGSRPASRTSKLKFGATTIACDPQATIRASRDDREHRLSGVFFVAGDGHLERRVTPPLAR